MSNQINDPYKILGVSRNVTREELKKAYHKKAQEYHPDLPGGDNKMMSDINEAYAIILKDIKKRDAFFKDCNAWNNEFEKNTTESTSKYTLTKEEQENLNNIKEVWKTATIFKNKVDNIINKQPNPDIMLKKISELLNALVSFLRKYIQYDINNLDSNSYNELKLFINQVGKPNDNQYAKWLVEAYINICREEVFPVLHFTPEFLEFIRILENSKNENLANVLNILKEEAIDVAKVSSRLYKLNPQSKNFNNLDPKVNEIAADFTHEYLSDVDNICAILSKKHLFDDYIMSRRFTSGGRK